MKKIKEEFIAAREALVRVLGVSRAHAGNLALAMLNKNRPAIIALAETLPTGEITADAVEGMKKIMADDVAEREAANREAAKNSTEEKRTG